MKKNIKKVFEKHFDKESYKLVKIWHQDGTGHEHYAIIDKKGVTGIIVEFSISDNVIYEATSVNALLDNVYTLSMWMGFLAEVEGKQRVVYSKIFEHCVQGELNKEETK